jgi:hypothetical protein
MKVFKLELEYVEPAHFSANGIAYIYVELPDSENKISSSENTKP